MPRYGLAVLALAALSALTSVASTEAAARSSKTCVVHRFTASGKKVVFKVEVYEYKIVRRNGRRLRTIVKREVPLRGSCAKSKACVKVKLLSTGKLAIVVTRKRVRVRVKSGNRLVYRTLTRKVPVLGRCVKPDTGAKPTPDTGLGVPVRITVIPPSRALLDFGTFTRETPIGGTLTGYVPQARIDITKDIPIVFTSASIALGATPIYVDTLCGGRNTASLRTGKQASVLFDGSRESTSLLTTTGAVTAATYFIVRMPLELRNGDDGCDKPYIDTQYSEWPLSLLLSGKLDPKTGLTKLHLTSPPVVATDLKICLNPGLQTEPCAGYEVPLPIQISTDVYVRVELNPK